MTEEIENGTLRDFDGKPCIYYFGYWIRYYKVPENTLATKHLLIKALTRRAFHLTEQGINTPGEKLEEARQAYELETDPSKKRINAAMLAGALFNRASDIFTVSVELAEKGIEIGSDNSLRKLSAEYFTESLEFGKFVKHYSGDEGIDEVWGEPIKAFTQPVSEFYKSRYIKISNAMQSIDEIASKMQSLLSHFSEQKITLDLIDEYADVAKLVAETMKRDNTIFQIWPQFTASKEKLLSTNFDDRDIEPLSKIALKNLVEKGCNLINFIADARVPMPKSKNIYFLECDEFLKLH